MGGSSPAGSTTTTTTNTPYNAAELNNIQESAINLGQSDPIQYYPGQTYANANGYQTGGYTAAGDLGQNAASATANLVPGAQAASITGNAALAEGGAMSAASPYLSDLSSIAGGSLLNANPYVAGEVSAAAQPVINAYMTATAPQTSSQMEAAGRYYSAGPGGTSGANQNAQSINEQNLGTALNNLASTMYGNDFTNAENLTEGAASSGANAVTGLANNAVAAQTATPSVTAQPTTDLQTEINAGGGLQQLAQNLINQNVSQFYGTEEAPWTTLSQEGNIVGGAIPGTTSTTSPYFENPIGQIAGLATGTGSLLTGASNAGLIGGK